MSDNVIHLGMQHPEIQHTPDDLADALIDFAYRIRTGEIKTETVLLMWVDDGAYPMFAPRGKPLSQLEALGLMRMIEHKILKS